MSIFVACSSSPAVDLARSAPARGLLPVVLAQVEHVVAADERVPVLADQIAVLVPTALLLANSTKFR